MKTNRKLRQRRAPVHLLLSGAIAMLLTLSNLTPRSPRIFPDGSKDDLLTELKASRDDRRKHSK